LFKQIKKESLALYSSVNSVCTHILMIYSWRYWYRYLDSVSLATFVCLFSIVDY